jgi:hypothetical protein
MDAAVFTPKACSKTPTAADPILGMLARDRVRFAGSNVEIDKLAEPTSSSSVLKPSRMPFAFMSTA